MLLLKDFYFIRHGETEPHLDDNNISLNRCGIAQIQQAAPLLKGLGLAGIYSSPLPRALETSKILNPDNNITINQVGGLSECTCHVWNHLTSQDELTDPDTKGFVSRVLSAFEDILKQPGPVLIVAHGGVHYALCQMLELKNHPWKIGNGQLIHFTPGKNEWKARILGLS